MVMSGQLHASAVLSHAQGSVTRWIGVWMGPRFGLDLLEEIKISCSCRDSNSGRSDYGTSTT
jgi:hypothetical protein